MRLTPIILDYHTQRTTLIESQYNFTLQYNEHKFITIIIMVATACKVSEDANRNITVSFM